MRYRIAVVARRVVPILLIVAGVHGLISCEQIPSDPRYIVPSQRRLDRTLGDADSKKPVRRFRATTQDVHEVLGAPLANFSGRTDVYAVKPIYKWVCWVDALGNSSPSSYLLRLDYDQRGILKAYEVRSGYWTPAETDPSREVFRVWPDLKRDTDLVK